MYQSLFDIPFEAAEKFPDRVSHKWPTRKGSETRTFREFARYIQVLSAGFIAAGLKKGDHVGFFVNNRYEWIVTDFSLMASGAVSVPRGSDTAPREVAFIFSHSDSCCLILENVPQLASLTEVFTDSDWEKCTRIFIIDRDDSSDIPETLKGRIMFYDQLESLGNDELSRNPDCVRSSSATLSSADLLTIVYTSGTTGNPKGVMLTHANFLQNVYANTPRLQIDPAAGETTVVMLPSWHVYERAFEYCALTTGVTVVYSSPGRFSADLAAEKPQVLISVPRVWESVYQKLIKAMSEMPAIKRGIVFLFVKINQSWMSSVLYLKGCYISLRKRSWPSHLLGFIQALLGSILFFPGHLLAGVLFKPFKAKVGGRLRAATCAAGSFPKYLDEIFNSLGIVIVNAYGMTECAPGIVSRTIDRNTFGSTGIPFDNTEVEIRREDGSITSIGEKGVVFVRGPQVMLGYYKNPAATEAVLSSDGWLNTGDLAVRSENGEIVIVGRMKDTIVLMGGENVEPDPIEDKMKESQYIDHAVLLGQDQKQLSAIIAINEDELMRLAAELKLSRDEVIIEGNNSIENDVIYKHLLTEVNSLISKEQGFMSFERISRIFPVFNDFSVGKELTQTLKVKRKYVEERFKSLVDTFFGDSGTGKKK